MSVICLIDQTAHVSLDDLHAYIKSAYKMGRERYYRTYVPRFDLFTKAPIPFKDAEQYLAQDFVDKNSLKKWLKQVSTEEGLAWAKGWLSKRKEAKQLVYAPSQTELRTLCCPTMPYYEVAAAKEGGYYGVTRELGFKDRYENMGRILTEFYTDPVVIQDTREQSPVKLSNPVKKDTLEVGDYALAAPWDQGIRIERKSLSDFCGTLSGRKQIRENKASVTEWSNLERFDRELARAVEKNLYVVMMVEANINDAQRFDYLPQTKWVGASPAYVMKNLRDLLVKYPLHFQAVFVDGRAQMADKMMKVLSMGDYARKIDLQWMLEKGDL